MFCYRSSTVFISPILQESYDATKTKNVSTLACCILNAI